MSFTGKLSSTDNPNRLDRAMKGALGKLSRYRRAAPKTTKQDQSVFIDIRGPLGLNILHDPHEPVIDFIFVHGLGGGSRKTWSLSEDPQHFWPKEWLPQDVEFSSVRIHSFGYSADWDEWKRGTLDILDFARSLLGDISCNPGIRRSNTNIVLIGHSMGGIVIKKAYILAREDPDLKDLANRIHTLYFLATPHRGSDFSKLFADILRVSYGLKPLVSELSRDSDSVANINDNFRSYAKDVQLWSFYETDPSNHTNTRAIIVDRSSATLGYPNERSYPLKADHRGVCKFHLQTDSNYRTLRNSFSVTIDKILSDNSRLPPLQHDQLAEFTGVFNSPDNELSALEDIRVPGSCEWFVRREIYKSWQGGQPGSRPFLWLTGNAGCGKSVLSSRITHELQQNRLGCSYFFFHDEVSDRSNIVGCLRALAYQMATADNSVLQRLLEAQKNSPPWEKLDEETIWRNLFLGCIFKDTNFKTQYWVIDAVDECQKFQAFLNLLTTAPLHLRIFFTSRENPDIKRLLDSIMKNVEHYRLQEEDIISDFSKFIESRMDFVPVSGENRGKLHQRILEKASGSFSWVSYVIQRLQMTYSEEEAEEVLDEVLPRMNEHYGIKSTIEHVPDSYGGGSEEPNQRSLGQSSGALGVSTDGIVSSIPLTTDQGKSIFIPSGMKESLNEDQDSLYANTFQKYSTDSGYGSLQSQHSSMALQDKSTLAQTKVPLLSSMEEEVDEEVQSNRSVEDTPSYTSSSDYSLIGQEIKETAHALILEMFEQDEVLNPLFKDALERYDRARVVKNLAGFLKGFCSLLLHERPTVHQKRGVVFVRHRARHFAHCICENLDPSRLEADKLIALEKTKNSEVERKLRLARWMSVEDARTTSPARSILIEDEDGSELESSASSDGLPPLLEDIRNFMVLGEPLRLFRQYFARFAAGESIKEWNTITKNRGLSIEPPIENLAEEEHISSDIYPDPTKQGFIIAIPERKVFRVSWRCRCGREFHSLVPTTDRQIAENFWRRVNWNVQRDGPMIKSYFKFEWTENIVWAVAPRLLSRFTRELTPRSPEAQDLEASANLRVQSTSLESSEQPSQRADVNIEVANSGSQISNRNRPIYICLYERKDTFWRLRHAKLRQNIDISTSQVQESRSRTNGVITVESGINLPSASIDTPNKANMNKELFNALREKILRCSPPEAILWGQDSILFWKSPFLPGKWKFKVMLRKSCYWLWKIFDPVTVSGLEFWEFKLNPVPKLVDPVQKDKLPRDADPSPGITLNSNLDQSFDSDWEFSPLVGEELSHFKGLISGKTLLHLLMYPDHANAELPIWSGLPKKIRTKLVNQRRIQVPGWGFQVEHKWNSVAFMIMTSPVIIIGIAIATVLTIKFKWPVSAGVSLAVLPVTLIAYINTMVGGATK